MNNQKGKLTDADKMEALLEHDYLNIPYSAIAKKKNVSITTVRNGAEDARNNIIENLALKYYTENLQLQEQLRERNYISCNEYDEY